MSALYNTTRKQLHQKRRIMLIDFYVSNFMRFNGFFSFNQRVDEYPLVADKNIGEQVKLIKISGGNSCGKTSVLQAIKAMRDCVRYHDDIDAIIIPHLSQKKEKTVFEIVFVKDGIKYEYAFAVKEKIVIYEKLNNEDTKTTVFSRAYDSASQTYKWNFDKKLFKPSNLVKSWVNCTRKDALFLLVATQLNSMVLQPIVEWFLDLNFIIDTPIISSRSHIKSDELVKNAIETHNSELLKLAQLVDKTVTSIDYDKYHELVFLYHQSDEIEYPMLLLYESNGMKKLFEIAPLLIDTMLNREVIIIDNLECYFDKNTLSKIMKQLNDFANGVSKQLIYTSLTD